MSGAKGSSRVPSKDEFQQMTAASEAVKAKRVRSSDQSERWERRHRAQSFIQGKELDELEMEVETGLYENVDLSHGSRMPIIIAHVFFSKYQLTYCTCIHLISAQFISDFLWWSVFDAMLPMVWFFPLCALEVSGYEVVILLWFSPLLALFGPVRRALATPSALLVFRLLTLVGVASYQTPTSLARLLVLGVGNSFAFLAFVSMWWGHSKLDRLIPSIVKPTKCIAGHLMGERKLPAL